MSAGQGELIAIENLIHETFSSEIPLEMKSHMIHQLHFYFFFQERHLWIKNVILSGSNILVHRSVLQQRDTT
jgi:hypothetical protein